jgi:hypothetical protein
MKGEHFWSIFFLIFHEKLRTETRDKGKVKSFRINLPNKKNPEKFDKEVPKVLERILVILLVLITRAPRDV